MITADRWEIRERLSSRYAMPTPSKRTERSSEQATKDANETLAPVTEQTMVLVAEDEETIAETLALIVEDAGYIPLVAHDGREALALARQHRPHLIITDLMMPYVTGSELIAAIRDECAANGATPPAILVVTAASRSLARESGADAVLTKPFDVSTLEAEMLRLIQQRSM